MNLLDLSDLVRSEKGRKGGMTRSNYLSLKVKIFLLLTALPLAGLLIFALATSSTFKTDRVNDIFETSLSVTKSQSFRIKSELMRFIQAAKNVESAYDYQSSSMSSKGWSYLDQNLEIRDLSIFQIVPEKDVVHRYFTSGGGKKEFVPFDTSLWLKSREAGLRKRQLLIELIDVGGEELFMMAIKIRNLNENRYMTVVLVVDSVELQHIFSREDGLRNVLVNLDNEVLLGFRDAQERLSHTNLWTSINRSILGGTISDTRITELDEFFAGYSRIGIGDLYLLNLIPKREAFASLDIFYQKALLFFLSILSVLTIVAVLSSRILTSKLRELIAATKRISDGNFDIKVAVDTRDEVGSLSESFNAMAVRVSELIVKSAENARMEGELETAQAIQGSLFPQSDARFGDISISGCYVPATECSGDWWYYFDTPDKIYIMVGDATGHGVSSALITSAARAAISIFETRDDVTLETCLLGINRAVYSAGNQNVMMTFFIAAIDKLTGELTYINASHNPPVVLHEDSSSPSGKGFHALLGGRCSRLGETLNLTFEKVSFKLRQGDRLILFTDGFIEGVNSNGKQFGERRFLNGVLEYSTTGSQTSLDLQRVLKSFNDFRGQEPLGDDVTLVFCDYGVDSIAS